MAGGAGRAERGAREELFAHVESSLFNGIKQDMHLEVSYKSNPDVYWIAKISMVCGHLLRIRFIGAESDFWCDITTTKVHRLGWCSTYEELVDPPDDIKDRFGDSIIDLMKTALKDAVSVSEEALNNKGLSPIDRIKAGMKVEVQNNLDPFRYWIATVRDNIGGRLLLKYDGSEEDLEDFWVFYTSPRLCSFGFVTNKGSPWQFKYPGKVNKFSCRNKLSAHLRLCAEDSIKHPTPSDLFQPSPKLEPHTFVIGMKLEALDPKEMSSVRPATVIKVFNCYYFLVAIDDFHNDYEETKMAWLCDLTHPYIFPVGWAQNNSMRLTKPKIWKSRKDFDWDDYLSITSSVPAPEYCFGPKAGVDGFELNTILEAVNPKNENEVYVATIERVVEHLVGLELSNGDNVWYAQNSDRIFPVGWCDSNDYVLQKPKFKKKVVKEKLKPEEILKSEEEWCDRIYFNYKCYAGPMISKNKLAQLPKSVGPGPLSLVIKEVLNMMISASYKPAKMLKDWEHEGSVEEGMRLELLKAKLKTSPHRAYVQVATTNAQVPLFCREMCVKMQACPFLFGPLEFTEKCPETCQLVDKCRFHNAGDRRGKTNGKKKRKKGLHYMTIRAQERRAALEADGNKDGADSGNESENSPVSTPQQSEAGTRPNSPDSVDFKKQNKRKKPPKNKYPKLEMKTRGAKLPNFAIQMKEGHWNKKDVETIYNKTCALPKKPSADSDSERESSHSTSSNKNNELISDVSDSEEPELKKLKFMSHDPQPTDNKLFERNLRPRGRVTTSDMPWTRKLKLTPNPLHWTVNDVHKYLSDTEDCKMLADRLREEEIDGPAFIMLKLTMIEDFLHMRSEYAMHLCKHITRIKYHYMEHFQEPTE